MSLWPPFLGAGVRVKSMSPDFREIEVEMKARFWNKNYVGSHFGGSLYSMTDPFYMLMLLENLGKNYIVWDKSATIRFKKPAYGKVTALFNISQEELYKIKSEADANGRSEPNFLVLIKDEQGNIVTEIEKIISVKPKKKIKEK